MSSKGSGVNVGKGTIILILVLASFSIMAAMPASFYLNLNDMGESLMNGGMLEQFMDFLDRIPLFDFTGNLSDFFDMFDFPTDPIDPGDFEIPPGWEIPDFDWGDLPEGWEGELPPFIPGDLPDGFEIPDGWLPDGIDPGDYPGLMGLGLGLFGTEAIKVWVNSTLPNRYWNLRTYDTFNSSNWIQSDDITSDYNYTTKSPIPSSEKYLVWMNISYQQNGSGSLPIPHLWPSAEVIENLTVYSPAIVNWTLLTDSSGATIWNATISNASSSLFTISLVYNATYDETITPNSIYSQMTPQTVDGTPFDPPGQTKYRLLPTLDPAVISDMENVKNKVFPKGLSVYNASMAVLEYFKTRYSWVAYINRTNQFNASQLVKAGYGTDSDFASNFALYLRYLNISSRLAWGGVGYSTDPSSPTSNNMYRLSPIFYTEVWIPNATNTGGNWLQLDPTPVPDKTYAMDGPGSFFEIYPRIPDDRMETYHYTLSVLSNTSNYMNPLNHLNRNSDSFELNATLYKDGIPISQTELDDIVNFTFYDETDDLILGYNGSIGATWVDSFTDSSFVGPHKVKTLFFGMSNNTIIVLNGTTSILKDSLGNPDPVQVKRGLGNSFIFYANLSDSVNNKPISDTILGANISNWELIRNNPCMTNESGVATMNLSVNASISTGVHNMIITFNGIFILEKDFPNLPPDLIFVSAAVSNSSTHQIIIETDISISINKLTNFSNNILVRDNNITIYGRVSFDNGTAISNAPVDIHWQNFTGEFIFGPFYTNSSGWYNYTNFITCLHESSVIVWANTTLPFANKTSSLENYNIYCQDNTTIHLYDPSVGPYVIRGDTSIPITGYLIDPLGVADMSNQQIDLYDKASGQRITQDGDIMTNANGNFSTLIDIPIISPVGNHDIFARFNGTWNAGGTPIDIPSSASNSTEYIILVVAQSLLVKNLTGMEVGRYLEPSAFIPIGDTLNIYGYLAIDNSTALTSETVNAWETFTNGTTIFLQNDITDGTGFYNISYAVPISHPTGNSLIFVNYSAGNIFSSYMTNATASEDPEFGYLCDLIINSVTPGSATRGLTPVSIQGSLSEVYYGTILEGERMYITFNSNNVRDNSYQEVFALINGTGSFTADFIVSNSLSENNYVVNATPYSSIIHYNSTITSSVMLNASSTVSTLDIKQTPIAGETLNISGSLQYENGTDLSGQIIIYAESNSSNNMTVPVNGDYFLSLPLDPSLADTNDNLIVEYVGDSYISSSSSSTPIYIGDSPIVTIDVPSSAYQNNNFNIYGNVIQNGNPYFNRSVVLYVSNTTHNNIFNQTVYTDINGNFFAILLINRIGNYTIKANLTSIGSFSSSEVLITIIESPNLLNMLWILWIILPVVIGLIIGIIGVKMAIKKHKKEKKKKIDEKIDPNRIKNNIQSLCDGERHKEAVIYAYLSFLEIIRIYRGKQRQPSQSIREFAMDLVKNMKFPPKNVYPFTSLYEEARFSNHKIDKNRFEEVKILFDALVSPIVKRATLG